MNFIYRNTMDGIDAVVYNPDEPHIACVLLLDTSSSMSGAPIESLNKAINDFKEKISMNEHEKKCVDVAIIEFNDEARVVQEFVPLAEMKPITLSATGCSAMGAGIKLAIDKVKERIRFYDSVGTPRYQPWIVMITDGSSTDDISEAKQKIFEEENRKKLKFLVIGLHGCDTELIKTLTKRTLLIKNLNFLQFLDAVIPRCNPIVEQFNIGSKPSMPNDLAILPQDWDW
jgi:uncharacterized protein YegL